MSAWIPEYYEYKEKNEDCATDHVKRPNLIAGKRRSKESQTIPIDETEVDAGRNSMSN